MSPALQAHLRLLHSTPAERVHTHEQRIVMPHDRFKKPGGTRRSPIPSAVLHERIVAMKLGGASHREVMDALSISWTTVSKHWNKHLRG